MRPCGPPLIPRKSLLLQTIIHVRRKRGSLLGPLPEPAGSPESQRATAGTSSPLERTGRRGPAPRAAPEGAANGTYRTFGPLPGAPPPDHDRRPDADELAVLDDHRRQRAGRRSAPGQDHRLAGSPGLRRDAGPISARNARLRGHLRGHGWSSGSHPPLPLRLPLPRDRQRGSRDPLAPSRFVACWRIRPPPLGRRAGLGTTPLRSTDLRSRDAPSC